MAYPYPYQPGYPAMYPGYYTQPGQMTEPRQQVPAPMQQQSNTQQSGGGILWVQGEEGAKAYMIAPGASVLLMDSENSSFYIKSSDPSGMPLPLRIFDYKERDTRTAVMNVMSAQSVPSADYVTRDEFNALAARLNEMATAAGGQHSTTPADVVANIAKNKTTKGGAQQ